MTAQAWATLIVGLAGVIGVAITISQRTRADNRREWWQRFSHALSATYSTHPDERRDGWIVLESLLDSPLATRTEEGLIKQLALRDTDYTDQGRPT